MDAERRDATDLRRGLALSIGAGPLRAALAVLLAVALALHGPERFGLFLALQAPLHVAARAAALGLDRALLAWLGTDAARRLAGPALRGVLALTGAAASLVTLALIHAGGPPLLAWMALALVPMVLTEVLVHAALARRRLAAPLLVREGVIELGTVVLAIALHRWDLGLAVAFVVARVAGLAAALLLARRALAADLHAGVGARLPRGLLRAGLRLWLWGLVGALHQRLDLILLGALAEPRQIGVYAACQHLAGAVRQLRRAFEPMVLAVVAEPAGAGDRARLAAAFDRAAALVTAAQAPVLAALIAFAGPLLDALGGLSSALLPALLLCLAAAVEGTLGVHGLALIALGRADLGVVHVLLAMSLMTAGMLALVPPFGVLGAALAVGLAGVSLALLQRRAAARLLGRPPRLPGRTLAWIALGALAMALAWHYARPLGDLPARALALLAFTALALPGALRSAR